MEAAQREISALKVGTLSRSCVMSQRILAPCTIFAGKHRSMAVPSNAGIGGKSKVETMPRVVFGGVSSSHSSGTCHVYAVLLRIAPVLITSLICFDANLPHQHFLSLFLRCGNSRLYFYEGNSSCSGALNVFEIPQQPGNQRKEAERVSTVPAAQEARVVEEPAGETRRAEPEKKE